MRTEQVGRRSLICPFMLAVLSKNSAFSAVRQVFGYISGWLMSTFYDRFRECAQRWPTNVALEIQRRDQVESYTYAELRQMAESVGRWLTEQGLPTRARIAIFADNHPRWVAAYLGIIASGNAAVPSGHGISRRPGRQAAERQRQFDVVLRCKAPQHRARSCGQIRHWDRTAGRRTYRAERWCRKDRPRPHLRRRVGRFCSSVLTRGCPRFPALYLRHDCRSQGCHAHPRQSHGRSAGRVRLGRRWSRRRGARRASTLSCAFADGKSAAAPGEGSAGGLSRNPQHDGALCVRCPREGSRCSPSCHSSFT